MRKGIQIFNRENVHGLMSVTKSFTSTLIGIAIDKGMIKGTDAESYCPVPRLCTTPWWGIQKQNQAETLAFYDCWV